MRGAALYFSQRIDTLSRYDVLIVSDLMSFADFKALAGPECPPTLVYFHENQLTYPLAPGETRDFHFGFTDITTALTADLIRFNSKTHQDAFFAALSAFIPRLPEFRPRWVVDAIRRKAGVLYPGVDLPLPGDTSLEKLSSTEPPLIIWNHRWEFDKDPKTFFEAVDAVLAQGLDFRLALLGENFQAVPKEFLAARDKYGQRIVQYGYESDRSSYLKWLRQGTVIISTALQENFGLAVIEAIGAGCFPLLPNRLAYPEIIDAQYHGECLYRDKEDLAEKLIGVLTEPNRFAELRIGLSAHVQKYTWAQQIGAYDNLLASLSDGNGDIVKA